MQVHGVAVDQDAHADEVALIDAVFLRQLADHQGADRTGQGPGEDHQAALVGTLFEQRL
ncbi:hypothetical protein D3C72_2512960 [compost metagenome]